MGSKQKYYVTYIMKGSTMDEQKADDSCSSVKSPQELLNNKVVSMKILQKTVK